MQQLKDPFNDLDYQKSKLRQVAELIQNHASDGSAFQNCRCIQEKHLDEQAAYAAETVPMITDEKAKNFLFWLAQYSEYSLKNVNSVLDANDDTKEREMWMNLADDEREIRKEIVNETWNIPNPAGKRAYLPHGLTIEEKHSEHLQKKLSRCIDQVEQKCCDGHSTILYEDGHANYDQCTCNPVAVCRSEIEK
jgi:hypothetical protein